MEQGDAPAKRARLAEDAGTDPLATLRTPCYAVDVDVARRNAERMLARSKDLGVALRPHVKTHKTIEGALLATGGERSRITVSTLAEARFFADGGFDDILYAVPITPDKLDEAAGLTARLQDFHVMVDHPGQLDALLARAAPAASKPWSVVIMVDCGYGRDGVDPDADASVALAKRVAEAPTAKLAGIYTHGGHSYDASSVADVVAIGEAERDAVVGLAKKLKAAGVQCGEIGVGSTPTSSNPPSNLAGVTEMHPGNFLYYDMMQVQLGSCKQEDIAVRVCTRVIGQYERHNTLLIDCGWTGASAQGKEQGYGAILGHPELTIKVFKQEAGEVGSADGSPLDFSRYPIGTILQILPWHSCAATHQHTHVNAVEKGRLVGKWQQVRGW